MQRFKIKKKYEGIVMTRNVYGLGSVHFDYYKILPEHYYNYHQMGFPIFDVIETKKTK